MWFIPLPPRSFSRQASLVASPHHVHSAIRPSKLQPMDYAADFHQHNPPVGKSLGGAQQRDPQHLVAPPHHECHPSDPPRTSWIVLLPCTTSAS